MKKFTTILTSLLVLVSCSKGLDQSVFKPLSDEDLKSYVIGDEVKEKLYNHLTEMREENLFSETQRVKFSDITYSEVFSILDTIDREEVNIVNGKIWVEEVKTPFFKVIQDFDSATPENYRDYLGNKSRYSNDLYFKKLGDYEEQKKRNEIISKEQLLELQDLKEKAILNVILIRDFTPTRRSMYWSYKYDGNISSDSLFFLRRKYFDGKMVLLSKTEPKLREFLDASSLLPILKTNFNLRR